MILRGTTSWCCWQSLPLPTFRRLLFAPARHPNMVARGVVLSVVVGVALSHAPRTACFSTVAVVSYNRARKHQAAPHSSRWSSKGARRRSGVGSAATPVRLRAVEDPAAAPEAAAAAAAAVAAAAAAEREPDEIDLDIETQASVVSKHHATLVTQESTPSANACTPTPRKVLLPRWYGLA